MPRRNASKTSGKATRKVKENKKGGVQKGIWNRASGQESSSIISHNDHDLRIVKARKRSTTTVADCLIRRENTQSHRFPLAENQRAAPLEESNPNDIDSNQSNNNSCCL